MIDFYNYLCVCPYCGRTMKGHRAVEPSCDSPYASVNTLGTTGGTMYHYLHAEWGIYVVSPYLEMAQQDAVPGSTITDNCGNTFEA